MKLALTAMAILTSFGLSFISISAAQPVAPNPPHDQLECVSCHQAGPTARPTMQQCQGCHGSYAQIAQRTEKPGAEFNPHYSHRGQEECTNCHSLHGQSQFICNDCHGFQMSNPNFK